MFKSYFKLPEGISTWMIWGYYPLFRKPPNKKHTHKTIVKLWYLPGTDDLCGCLKIQIQVSQHFFGYIPVLTNETFLRGISTSKYMEFQTNMGGSNQTWLAKHQLRWGNVNHKSSTIINQNCLCLGLESDSLNICLTLSFILWIDILKSYIFLVAG